MELPTWLFTTLLVLAFIGVSTVVAVVWGMIVSPDEDY